MRAKLSALIQSRLVSTCVYIFALGLAMLFFAYVGYVKVFRDGATAAEKTITMRINALKANTTASTVKTSEYYGLRRAEIALNEHQKGVVESPMGCNCGPDVDRYTEGKHAQWCTMFASWVTKEAGSPVLNNKTDSWKIENSRDFAEYLQNNGTWHTREEVIAKNLQPQIGDYVVFWRGDYEDNLGHVDIVVLLDGKPGAAGLIGGNLKGQIKYRYFSYVQEYGFIGFGHPEKEIK